MKITHPGRIGFNLTLIARTRRAFVANAMSEYGFAPPMYEIAIYIWRHPGGSQDAVTEATLFDKATVARGAQKLEALGYIRRQCSERDRRQYELYLTEKGEVLASDAYRAFTQWTDILTRGLSETEKQYASALLERMARNID